MRNRAKHYKMVRNAFCPTGVGGGQDNSCSSNGGGTIKDKSGAEYKVVYDGDRTFSLSVPGKENLVDKGVTSGGVTLKRDKTGVMSVAIRPEFQRKGLATALYAHIEKYLGYSLKEGWATTPDGEAFWKSRKNKVTTNARPKSNKRASPLRFDPTRTTTLRRAFVARLRRGFARLRLAVVDLIARQDALGLREVKRVYNGYNPSSDIQKAGKWLSECGKAMPGYGQIFLDRKGSGGVWYVGGDGDERGFDIVVKKKLLEIEGIDEVRYESEYFPPRREDWVKVYPQQQTTTNERWRFHSDPDKLKQFQDWLKTQIKAFLVGMTEEELWTRYVEEGFKKGAGRAFEDVKPRSWGTPAQAEFYAGSKDQFLKSAFGRPESVGKVRLLASRSFDEMKGMTEDMTLKMGRALVDGLTRGANPREIAGDLVKQVGLSRTRAETIAQTEIIRAHAEGQLQAFEEMGVDEIGVMVEWTVTEDEALCDLCAAMQGVVLKIEEARGMIPRHPRCRCAFTPANVGEATDDQTRGKSKIVQAVKISARMGNDGFSTAVPVSKVRPTPPVPVTTNVRRFSRLLRNVFCPTGVGGGVDPSCSPGSGESFDDVTDDKELISLYEKTSSEVPRSTLKLERDQQGLSKEFYKGTVSGLRVKTSVPNEDSLSGYDDETSLTLKGIREVPMSVFEDANEKTGYKSADDEKKTERIAAQIKENGWVSPLIVVKDAKGFFILEGSHRYEALKKLGVKSIPAKVLIDHSEPSE